jgi:ABC-type transport system substrate-binding protein
MNTARRKALYAQMQQIVVDDCPVAFIGEAAWSEAYAAKVDNPPRGIWGVIDGLTDVAVRKT